VRVLQFDAAAMCCILVLCVRAIAGVRGSEVTLKSDCSMLQCVAVNRCVLQCVAVCCSVLQCVVVFCSGLPRAAVRLRSSPYVNMSQFFVLQCVALCYSCCSVLHYELDCCSVRT